MSVSLNDLQPKNITLTVKGVELTSKPLRLKHALILARVGKVFEQASEASNDDIETAQKEVDSVFAELIPELKDIELDMSATMELLQKLMGQIEPSDNKELSESKVTMNTDPKAQTTGL